MAARRSIFRSTNAWSPADAAYAELMTQFGAARSERTPAGGAAVIQYGKPAPEQKVEPVKVY